MELKALEMKGKEDKRLDHWRLDMELISSMKDTGRQGRAMALAVAGRHRGQNLLKRVAKVGGKIT